MLVPFLRLAVMINRGAAAGLLLPRAESAQRPAVPAAAVLRLSARHGDDPLHSHLRPRYPAGLRHHETARLPAFTPELPAASRAGLPFSVHSAALPFAPQLGGTGHRRGIQGHAGGYGLHARASLPRLPLDADAHSLCGCCGSAAAGAAALCQITLSDIPPGRGGMGGMH